MPEPFEFVTVDALLDSDLLVVLAECQLAERNDWRVPAYLFRLQTESGEHVGRIRLRVGWNDDIIKYAGQIGYAVEPAFRGRRYAERACRLLGSRERRCASNYRRCLGSFRSVLLMAPARHPGNSCCSDRTPWGMLPKSY